MDVIFEHSRLHDRYAFPFSQYSQYFFGSFLICPYIPAAGSFATIAVLWKYVLLFIYTIYHRQIRNNWYLFGWMPWCQNA